MLASKVEPLAFWRDKNTSEITEIHQLRVSHVRYWDTSDSNLSLMNVLINVPVANLRLIIYQCRFIDFKNIA